MAQSRWKPGLRQCAAFGESAILIDGLFRKLGAADYQCGFKLVAHRPRLSYPQATGEKVHILRKGKQE